MEAQDLAAIGKLILQLVEGHILSRSDDYNYPVARSEEWGNLGKDADFWLGWCNKLLDPQLALKGINLEALETEFRPKATTKLPMILAGVGVILLLAVGAFFLTSRKTTAPISTEVPAKQETATPAPVQKTPPPEPPVAAAQPKPGDSAAGKLKSDAQAEQMKLADEGARKQKYDVAIAAAKSAWQQQKYGEVITQADAALAIKTSDPAAGKLKSDAQAEQSRLADEAARKLKYDVAIAAAKSTWQQQKYGEVITQADVALATKPGDPAAGKLKSDAQAELDKLAAVKEQEQQAAEAKAKALQQLDETFEVLLVQYAVLSPTNPRIRAPRAKAEKPIKNDIAFGQKDDDEKLAGKLEARFKDNGVLNQDDRQDLLNKLRKNITAHR